MARVLGIDGCKAGWVGVALGDSAPPAAYFGATIDDTVREAGEIDLVAIDIPIHPPALGARACDRAVKAFLGRQGSSVFLTPIRTALEAETYAEANAISREAGCGGISAQAFALRRKILEVDEWLPKAPCPVYEVHPETSFRVMATQSDPKAVLPSKRTWAGEAVRKRLLAIEGVMLPVELGVAGRMAAADDVLDAAAAAWSARRILARSANSFPAEPVEPGVIWV